MDRDQFFQDVMKCCQSAEKKADQPVPEQVDALMRRIDASLINGCCIYHALGALLSVSLVGISMISTDLGRPFATLPSEEINRRMGLLYEALYADGLNTIEAGAVLVACATELMVNLFKEVDFLCPSDGLRHE